MVTRRMSLSKLFSGNTGATPASSDASPASGDDPNKECAIKVVIRARPLSDRELLGKTPVIVNVTRTSVQVINPVVFLDPTYLEAISSPTKRVTPRDLPLALTAQGIAAATAAGECRTFHFDRCFGVDNAAANETEPFAHSYDIDVTTQRPNQELVFDEIGREMIESAFQGFNCTVLAYGQTGSGKTHTMVGEKTTKGKGLIPRVCEALFTEIDARCAREDAAATAPADGLGSGSGGGSSGKRATMYSAHVSYCEIYKEKVNDLLESAPPSTSGADGAAASLTKSRSPPTSPSHSSTSGAGEVESLFGSSGAGPARRTLRVREHPVTGPFVEGLSSRAVTCYADIAEEMLAGEKLRTVASTLMNPVSSRSHAVFTITFTQTAFDAATQTAHEKTSKISMIDLAGSERASASGTSGDRLKEGAMINKSLTTLGRVISALSKQGGERVPYRDSTLTWLLKESLGGNAKTTMIAMISPSSDNYDETMSTLRYAESAKRVINRAVVNEDKNARIIRQLRQEIQDLRLELERAKRSPRKRSNSNSGDAAAALASSLAERDAFHMQLLQEVDELRAQQALNAPAGPDSLPASRDNAERASGVYVHKTLPSLLVDVTKGFHPDSALAYVLVEGATVLGSGEQTATLDSAEPNGAACAAETTVPNETVDDAQTVRAQSPAKRSWSPTFLRRRSSSSTAATAASTEGTTENVERASPRRSSSPRKLKTRASASQSSSATRFYRLPVAREGDVALQHVRLVCTSVAGSAGGAPDTECSESATPFCVEVEPLDASALVSVNGQRLAFGDRVALHHGDQLQLGDVHRFSLYVPHGATAAQSIAQAPEAASSELPSPTRESLATLVTVANDLCATWNLNMEFALECDGDEDDSDNATVLVKKVLDRERYSLVKWKRPMLESKVAFMRQMAASLETSGTLVVAQHASEAESAQGRGTEREQDDRDTDDSMPLHAKISSHRDIDAPGDVADDAALVLPPTPPPTRVSSSLIDGSLEPAPARTTSTSSTSTSTLATPTVVRLIGHGRIYMPPLKSYSSGPMIAAVFDTTGQSIGKLFVHLQYTTATNGEQVAERRPSFLDLVRRPSLLTLPHAAKTPANVHTTMRVHLDKVVFDESQAMARDGVSLTLKRSSQAKALRISSSTREKVSSTADSGAPSGPTANFSTPKMPPVACDSGASTAKAPLTLFQLGKVFETRLSFGDTATQRKANGSAAPCRSNSASSGSSGGENDAPQDDFVAFEVWGYGQALTPVAATALDIHAPAPPAAASWTADLPAASRQLEFYVSVDIDERESDGISRPVAVKADGTLRIHANQPRRLNVRVTQADQQRFALASIASVRLARPFAASVDTASLSSTGGKSSQWLLSPSSIRTHSYEDEDRAAASETGADTSGTAAAAAVGPSARPKAIAPGVTAWRTLAVRTEPEQDVASRSVVASFKWDCDAQYPEVPDAEGSRSVYRVVVALTTTWSRVPIVLSKSIATKIAPSSVSTTLKLARELESTRMAWWARESFSRDYRLGTWYSADVAPTEASSESVSRASEGSGGDTSASETQVIVDAAVTRHIRGLQRLELVLELEHLRQQILKMTPFSATETVGARTASLDELSFDRVAESLSTLFENSDDDEQRFEIVALQRSTQLFVRKKTQRDVLIGVKYGNVVDLSPRDVLALNKIQSGYLDRGGGDATLVLKPTTSWRDEVHSTHFVTEPSHLASGAVSEMAGFLMLATALQVDEAAAAAAVVAPLPLPSPTSGARARLEKPTKAVKASWERRWFVLKRPFLYAYKTLALKDEVGVLDISRCQLITMAPASSSIGTDGARTGRRHSSSSHSSSSSSSSTRSGHTLSSQVLAAIPFSFQLVSRVGTKCVVWTLQASTAPEMRAWLVAIDPLKIQAREAVVLNNQSNVETPVITA